MDLWARRSDNAVREHLASLAETDGVTIFLTTHNMAEAEPLCQQVAVVRRGELLEVGHPDEPRARTGAPRVNVVGRGFTARVIEGLRRSSDVTNVVANNDHLRSTCEMKAGQQGGSAFSFRPAPRSRKFGAAWRVLRRSS